MQILPSKLIDEYFAVALNREEVRNSDTRITSPRSRRHRFLHLINKMPEDIELRVGTVKDVMITATHEFDVVGEIV